MRGAYLVIFTAVVLGAACTAEENASEPQSNQAGASLTGVPGRPGQTYVYECEDGTQFTTRVEGEKAWLFLRSGTVSLPHVEAASGAKFSDGKTTYWSKGESAMLERPDHARTECSNNRRAAIWEDAKLRGADFRAVGNEPGWHLEISRENGIYFVTNYGSDAYMFALPEPVSDKKAGTTSYSTSADGHELSILLERGPCMDTMSDEQFETTVTVKLDETTLRGCGRPLH